LTRVENRISNGAALKTGLQQRRHSEGDEDIRKQTSRSRSQKGGTKLDGLRGGRVGSKGGSKMKRSI